MHRFIILPPDEAVSDNADFSELFFRSMHDGAVIEVAPKKTPTPIAACYVEVLVFIGKAAASGVIGMYAVRLWQAMEQSLKEKFDEWTISFSDGRNQTQVDVKRELSEEGKARFKEALEELERLNKEMERKNEKQA